MTVQWEIIGHDGVLAGLAEARQKGEPAHAYLFTGPAHLGKVTVARRFAQVLLCEHGTACGTCAHCLLFAAGNHPDFLTLPRDEKLTIEQVRDLKNTLALKPHSAAFRVGLIPDAERLGIPAQNALLKLLEEPPERTVLILTASSTGQLLPTTVSRCRQVRFGKPATTDLEAALAKRGGDTVAAIRAANRRPGLALRFLDDPDSLAKQTEWAADLHAVLAADPPTRLAIAKRLADQPDLPELLDYWLGLHQEALRAEVLEADELSAPASELAKLYATAQLRHNASQLLAAGKRLRYNPNVVLLLEQTLLSLGES